MKARFATAASLLAILCSMPARADTQTITDGYLTVGYGTNSLALSSGESRHVQGWEGDGAIAFGLSDKIGAQFDVDLTELNSTFPNFRNKIVTSSTIHLFWRNSDFLAGGFAGLIHCNYMDLIGLGGEGHYFWGPATFVISAGYAEPARHQDAAVRQLTSVQAELRYFVTDNLRVDGNVSYLHMYMANFLQTEFFDTDSWGIGVNAEYAIPNTSLALLAGYQHSGTSRYFDAFTVDADTFRFGVRWIFGHDLRTRDRRGASLGNIGHNFGGLFGRVLGSGEVGTGSYGYYPYEDDDD